MFFLSRALLQSVFIFHYLFLFLFFSFVFDFLAPKKKGQILKHFSFFCSPFLEKNQEMFFSLYLKLTTFSLEKVSSPFGQIMFSFFLFALIFFEEENVFFASFLNSLLFSLLTDLFSSFTFFSSCFSPLVCLRL